MRTHPPSSFRETPPASRRQRWRDQRGQALVELGVTIVLFLLLSLGIIEFGRMLMIANMITHAARQGARIAAVTPPTNRNPTTKAILSTAAIEANVKDMIAQAVGTSAASTFAVNVTQPTVSGVRTVQVEVTGNVPYLFNTFIATGPLVVDRIVTFRDEG